MNEYHTLLDFKKEYFKIKFKYATYKIKNKYIGHKYKLELDENNITSLKHPDRDVTVGKATSIKGKRKGFYSNEILYNRRNYRTSN